MPIPGAKGAMIPLAPVVFEGHVMADPVGGLLWGPSRGRGKAVSSATRMLALPFFRETAARAMVCARGRRDQGGPRGRPNRRGVPQRPGPIQLMIHDGHHQAGDALDEPNQR
ncbi:MAG: hypothetical protein ACK587_10785 [Cyanobacteriota bacterium]